MSVLSSSNLIGFAATRDAAKARAFYEGALGLRFVADEQYALVLDANGIMVRVQKVDDFTPQPFSMLGWTVPDINAAVTELQARGVAFEHFDGMGQDALGVLTFPNGDKVAWFKDPDGNILGVTQFAG
jgi:catechol 2,3-dioxygenase-like lactoylglutathione lyase family enzyme